MIKSRKSDLSFAKAQSLGGVYNLVGNGSHSGDYLVFITGCVPIYFNMKGDGRPVPVDNPDSMQHFTSMCKYRPSDRNLTINVR